MAQACGCGLSTEKVAGIVIVAGLALCIGAWYQPKSAQARSDGSLAIEPTSVPSLAVERNAPSTDEYAPLLESTPANDAIVHAGSVLADRFANARLAVEDSQIQPQEMYFELNDFNSVRSSTLFTGSGLIELNEVTSEGTFVADFDGDGQLSQSDMLDFSDAFDQGDLRADLNGDGLVDSEDFSQFADTYETGARNPSTFLAKLVFKTGSHTSPSTAESGIVHARILRLEGQSASITINGETITVGGPENPPNK